MEQMELPKNVGSGHFYSWVRSVLAEGHYAVIHYITNIAKALGKCPIMYRTKSHNVNAKASWGFNTCYL